MFRVRINNSLDEDRPPLPTDEIITRVLRSKERETHISQKPYNLVTNNCETFSSWCRNDTESSQQVNNAAAIAGGKLVIRENIFNRSLTICLWSPTFLLVYANIQYIKQCPRTQRTQSFSK